MAFVIRRKRNASILSIDLKVRNGEARGVGLTKISEVSFYPAKKEEAELRLWVYGKEEGLLPKDAKFNEESVQFVCDLLNLEIAEVNISITDNNGKIITY